MPIFVMTTLALFAFTLDSLAAGFAPGTWDSIQGPNSYFAGTSNDGGELFGQACYPIERKCAWVVGLKQPCATGTKYPLLVNSDRGARSLEMTCVGRDDDGLYRYSIGEYDEIDAIVSQSSRLGLAMPLRGDQFHFVKFDVGGSKGPVAAMRRAAEAKMQEMAPH